MDIPQNLLYTEDLEWIKIDDDSATNADDNNVGKEDSTIVNKENS